MENSASRVHVEGFLLLTLPNCTITTPSLTPQTGYLALQCVTLDIPSESQSDRDVWLVMKLNSFEMIISPTQRVNYSRSMHTYMFLPEDESAGVVQVVVPLDPSNPASYEDLETLEVILSQYGVVHDFEGPSPEKEKGNDEDSQGSYDSKIGAGLGTSDFKGRLVLVDELDGEVVATLDEAVPIKEDAMLAAGGHEKDPVVINLPDEREERAGRIEAYVHPASPEERDMLMQTAGLISRGIVLATSALASGMTSVSNYYISHSTPNSKPVEFSPRTRANMKRIHKISGTAVTVTTKTTGAILSTLDYVANKVSDGNGIGSQLAPPPLPPRSGSPMNRSPGTPPVQPPPLPPRKPRLLNRLLASTDLLLTTLDYSTKQLIESGTDAVSASLAHKYGQDMSDVSRIAGRSVQNVGLVYIDVRGVGRRALLKKAGKAVIKARMGGRDVVLGPEAHTMQDNTMAAGRDAPFPPTAPQSTALLPEYLQTTKAGVPGTERLKK